MRSTAELLIKFYNKKQIFIGKRSSNSSKQHFAEAGKKGKENEKVKFFVREAFMHGL